MRVTMQYFVGLGAGFALACAFYAAVFFGQMGVPTEASWWADRVIKKKRAIAQAIQGPKLMIIGGSSAHFGFNADEIQKQTGFPTVNLGLHVSMGPGFYFNEMRKLARPGDVVLIAFEYEQYDWGEVDAGWSDTIFLDYILAREPDYFWSLSWREKFRFAMLVPDKRLKVGLKSIGKPDGPYHGYLVYKPEMIGPWGDQTGHAKANRLAERPKVSILSGALAAGLTPARNGFPLVRQFCEWAKAHGVRVLATFPAVVRRSEYDQPPAQMAPKAIQQLYQSLGVPVLENHRELMLEADLFFDTQYHPTEETARERSRKLAARLAPYLRK